MSINRLVTVLGILVWSSLTALTAQAPGTRGAAQDRLAAARTATCTFSLLATGTWTDGEAEAELKSSTLSFRFVDIDTEDATAEAVGQFGPADIITRLSGDYLHFLQMFRVGPLYATTIFNRETRDGKFMATHTRHEYTDVSLPGFTSRPEQYYGECEVR